MRVGVFVTGSAVRRLSGFLATAVLALAVGGGTGLQAAEAASPHGTIHYAENSSIPTLDPASWSGVTEQRPMSMIYDTLVEYDQTNAGLHPALAASYNVSPNGLVYTFHLRPGVKFSNGDPVTAADVVYSLNRVTSGDPLGAGSAPYSGAYSDIAGYQQWNKSGKTAVPGAPGMSGVSAPSPDVVKITLAAPQPYFLNELALTSAAVLDPRVVQEYGKNYELHAIGTGPYKLQSWNQGQQMVLVANPGSWRGAPGIAKIIIDENVNSDLQLLRFQQGQYDLMNGPLPSEVFAKVMSDPKLKKLYHTAPMNGVLYFAFNFTKPPFNNRNMRLAVNYAVNKALIVRNITNGRATIMSQPVPPGIAGYNKSLKPYPYNPGLARKYLKLAHYRGQPIYLIYPSQTQDRVRMAEMIQQNLRSVGMNVQIQGVSEWTAFNDEEYNPKANWNMAWYDWWQDYPDAQDFLENLLGTEMFNATNVGNWTNPKFQQLVDTADTLPPTENAQRIKDYQQAEVIAHNQAAWLFIYTLWQDDLVQPWIKPQGTKNDLMLYLHPVLTTQFNRLTTTR